MWRLLQLCIVGCVLCCSRCYGSFLPLFVTSLQLWITFCSRWTSPFLALCYTFFAALCDPLQLYVTLLQLYCDSSAALCDSSAAYVTTRSLEWLLCSLHTSLCSFMWLICVCYNSLQLCDLSAALYNALAFIGTFMKLYIILWLYVDSVSRWVSFISASYVSSSAGFYNYSCRLLLTFLFFCSFYNFFAAVWDLGSALIILCSLP